MSITRIRVLVYSVLAGGIAVFFLWLLLPVTGDRDTSVTKYMLSQSPFSLHWDGKGSELEAAIVTGDTAKAKVLIGEKPGQITESDVAGVTALHWAAFLGNVEVAEALLNKGADVDAHRCGMTPLGFAVVRDRWELVRLLCEHGAVLTTGKSLPRATGKHGGEPMVWSPLDIAVNFRSYKMVDYLLSKGADINDGDNGWGRTPLMTAVALADCNAVSFILAKGADVHKADNKGQTPLHVAAHAGCIPVAVTLLTDGADVNVADKDGQTPIYDAIYEAQVPMVEFLIAHGASLEIRNKHAQTPMEYATWLGKWKWREAPARLLQVLEQKPK
jgi:ankyrin repeat protein